MIEYARVAILATVNVAVSIPFEMEQVEEATGLPESEQVVSLVKNPEPDT